MKNNATTNGGRQASELVNALCQREFLFITGKGGVGKSCVAGVIGLEAARLGRRVLIVYPGDSEPGADLWGRPVQNVATEMSPGIFAMSVNSEDSMRQYTAEILGSAKLAAVLFHHRVARGLLTEIPGPSEWAILGRAWAFTKTGVAARRKGERAYDLVIVDAPSSGDGSGMLRMPRVVIDLAPARILRKDAESCLAMLQDDAKSQVVFVTLAEELSITETEENMEVVRRDLAMPLGPVFINQVVANGYSDEDAAALLDRPSADEENEPTESRERRRALISLRVGQHAATRQRLQATYLERVGKWQQNTLLLSRLDEDLVGISGLKKLQMTLAAGH